MHSASNTTSLATEPTASASPSADDGRVNSDHSELDDHVRQLLRDAAQAGPSAVEDARDQVVVSYLWLADGIARKFGHRGEDADDLQQIARTALVEAIRRYEPDRGPFAAFAVPTISGVLKRHFRDNGWLVRPPRHTQQLAVLINQQWSNVAQDRQCDPDDQGLAAALGESVVDIREARQAGQGYRGISLDTPTHSDLAAPSQDMDRSEARLIARQAWQVLTEEERELIRLRFWEGRSQSDIAERIGTNQMHVSRALSRTLNRIRMLLDVKQVA